MKQSTEPILAVHLSSLKLGLRLTPAKPENVLKPTAAIDFWR
jgi:hypothetical protein